MVHGFVFEYENGADRNYYKPAPKEEKIKVLKFTISGEYIGGFPSFTSAARSVQRDRKGVVAVLNGEQRTCGGHIFKRRME
jgi:hypothetical protein